MSEQTENQTEIETDLKTEGEQAQTELPEPETPEEAPEPPENKEFDQLVEQSTQTVEQQKVQHREAKQQQQAQLARFMPEEEACGYAVQGIQMALEEVQKRTGTPINISEQHIGLASMLFMPLVMKYGNQVKRYISNMTTEVDLESNTPEMLAAAGVAAVGIPVYLQIRETRPKKPRKRRAEQQQSEGESDGRQGE